MEYGKCTEGHGMYTALVSAKRGEEVRGIDSKHAALISFTKRTLGFAVGIEFETETEDGPFTSKHQILVGSVDEAMDFFRQFDLGEISWMAPLEHVA